MQQIQDSIEVQIVIAYPKKEQQKQQITPEIGTRPLLKEKELYRPTYDIPLLCATITVVYLFFLIYTKVKRLPIKTSFFAIFFQISNKEENTVSPLIAVLQHFVSFLLVTTLGYFLLKDFVPLSPFLQWIALAGCFSLYLILHCFLIFLTGYTVEKLSVSVSHYKMLRLLSKQFAIVVAPLLVIALFFPQKGFNIVFYGFLLGLILKLIVQLFLGYRVLRASKFSIFHSFLYLCTLEILPIVYIVMIIRHLIENN